MTKPIPLAEQLKQRMQREHEIIQRQTEKQLNIMGDELRDIVKNELATIKADMEEHNRSLSWTLIKHRLLWPTLIGLSLSVGILFGSWGMTQYLSNQIISLKQTVSELEGRGGKSHLASCNARLCAQIDPMAPQYENNYRILKGY